MFVNHRGYWCIRGMHKALGLIPGTRRKQEEKKAEKESEGGLCPLSCSFQGGPVPVLIRLFPRDSILQVTCGSTLSAKCESRMILYLVCAD